MAKGDWQYATATGELERALQEFHWQCAFVREASAVSPTRVLSNGQVDVPDAALDVRVLLEAACPPVRVVELHLHFADGIAVPAGGTELFPTTEVHHDEVRLSLTRQLPAMTCRALRWRVLSDIGDTHYGRPLPDDLDDPPLWESRPLPRR
ncbi:MAG: hypothetical protein QOH84_6538 [Kribbellaceae bacterium]|nr:hypothetical protein [Kribbellaceae bacterium]